MKELLDNLDEASQLLKVTRGNRAFMIPATRICKLCSREWPKDSQWVVKTGVCMCKSCWTKIITHCGTSEFPINTDWFRVCDDDQDGCMCRKCVIKRSMKR